MFANVMMCRSVQDLRTHPSLTLNTDANPFSFQYFYNTPRQILLI